MESEGHMNIFDFLSNIIEGIKNYFYKRKYNINPPIITGRIRGSVLKETVENILNCECFYQDYWYDMANIVDFERMIKYDETNLLPFEPDILDCDDFGRRLAGAFVIPGWSGLPVGTISCNKPDGEPHRMNIFVADDLKVYIVEPQNDKIYTPEDVSGYQIHVAWF